MFFPGWALKRRKKPSFVKKKPSAPLSLSQRSNHWETMSFLLLRRIDSKQVRMDKNLKQFSCTVKYFPPSSSPHRFRQRCRVEFCLDIWHRISSGFVKCSHLSLWRKSCFFLSSILQQTLFPKSHPVGEACLILQKTFQSPSEALHSSLAVAQTSKHTQKRGQVVLFALIKKIYFLR